MGASKGLNKKDRNVAGECKGRIPRKSRLKGGLRTISTISSNDESSIDEILQSEERTIKEQNQAHPGEKKGKKVSVLPDKISDVAQKPTGSSKKKVHTQMPRGAILGFLKAAKGESNQGKKSSLQESTDCNGGTKEESLSPSEYLKRLSKKNQFEISEKKRTGVFAETVDDYPTGNSAELSKKNFKKIKKIENDSGEADNFSNTPLPIHFESFLTPPKVSSSQVNRSFSNTYSGDFLETDVFLGQRVVITGLFDDIGSRETILEYIKKNGGEIRTAVSSLTNILLVGYILEDGRPVTEGTKYKKAAELILKAKKENKEPNIRIISYEGLIKIMKGNQSKFFTDISNENIIAQSKEMMSSLPSDEMPDSTKSLSSTKISSPETELPNIPWCEYFRPTKVSHLIGNSGLINDIQVWLTCWRETHAPPVNTNQSNKTWCRGTGGFWGVGAGAKSRCILLSGPPGIGKTSAINVIAKECGFSNIISFNASDSRNKSAIEDLADMVTGGITLNFNSSNSDETRNLAKCSSSRKYILTTILVLDEVDGMSTGDRGGIQAICKLIEKTRIPIVCICNDRSCEKIRTLASKCYDIRFNRPSKAIIAQAIFGSLSRIGINITIQAIEELCEKCGCDIRQVLNNLQFASSSHQPNVNVKYGDTKDKQVMTTPFEVVCQLLTALTARGMSFSEKLDAFFVDYDLLPLLVQDGYIKSVGSDWNSRTLDAKKRANIVLVQIADDLVQLDISSSTLRKTANWGLLPVVGTFCCVLPAMRISKVDASLSRSEFPRWFGKNSSFIKNRRLVAEIELSILPKTTTGGLEMLTSGYLDSVYNSFMKILGKNMGFERFFQMLTSYGLTKDMVVDSMSCLRLKSQPKLYDSIDARIKANFSRAYNKLHRALPKTFSTKDSTGVSDMKMNNENEDESIDKKENNESDVDDDKNVPGGNLVTKVVKKSTPTKGKAAPRTGRRSKKNAA